MTYKYQRGTALLSGSLVLDTGFSLSASSNSQLGDVSTGFAVGYVNILSASTVVSGAFFEGDASRLTGVSTSTVTTTGTSTDSTYYPIFADTAGGAAGETLRIHSTVSINPSDGDISGSGALTVDSITLNGDYSIANDGDAVLGAVSSSSGLFSPAGGINVAEAFTVSAAGAVVAGAVSSSSGLFSPAGGINVAQLFTVNTAGAVRMQEFTIGDSETIGTDSDNDLLCLNTSLVEVSGALSASTNITAGGQLTVGDILSTSKGFMWSKVSVTSSQDQSTDHTIVAADAGTVYLCASGSIVTLPDATANEVGTRVYVVKNSDGSASATFPVQITGAGSQLIDGGLHIALESPYASVNLYSDSSNWMIF
tara:strand:+ start:3681 stop:4781 length:1101 start_codon:yes stop_codon:yes gene_type:complete